MHACHRAIAILIGLVALALVPACGGGEEQSDTDGSGGSSAVTTTGSGNSSTITTTTGSGDTTSTATGGEVCHFSTDNPSCLEAENCACPSMDIAMPNGAPCPFNAGNVCGSGSNQCGCDLPIGEDYVEPDCGEFVNGDTWGDESGQYKDTTGATINENSQLEIGFGSLLGNEAGYFEAFVLSGKKIYFNQANRGALESNSGEFAPDCKSLVIRYYHAGETAPYLEGAIYYLHE